MHISSRIKQWNITFSLLKIQIYTPRPEQKVELNSLKISVVGNMSPIFHRDLQVPNGAEAVQTTATPHWVIKHKWKTESFFLTPLKHHKQNIYPQLGT